MKGPLLAIVAALTLLSVAASCILPLLWTRDEVVLQVAMFSEANEQKNVLWYREAALGLAMESGSYLLIDPAPTHSGKEPLSLSRLEQHRLFGWTELPHDFGRAYSDPHRWEMGTGWPMICLIAHGVVDYRSPSGSPVRIARRVMFDDIVFPSGGRKPLGCRAFDGLPSRVQPLGIAVNVFAHGLFWYLLVWLCATSFRAFMPQPG